MVIQEVTNGLSREQLVYSDERAFLGIDAQDQRVDYVPSDEVVIARHLLSTTPSGSKMHCYAYGPLIHYRLENIGSENPEFVLTHTFIRVENQLCAISNIDNETLLYEKRYCARDLMNPYEVERRAISRDEWHRAGLLMDLYQGDKQILSGNKLRHKQKYYRIFEIAEYDDEGGCCGKRIVKLTHTFYHINNKLYALSGNGHHISGGFGKVKIACEYAMQPDEMCQSQAELVALKIPKKHRVMSKAACEGIRSEYALYQATGLSIGSAVKQKSENSDVQQEICVMRFFHSDLHNNVAEGHLRKLVSHIASTTSLESRESLLINLIRTLTDIFLKLHHQLGININLHQFLHRDIKPENIVLITKPQLDSLGRVVSIQCIEAQFIDFGAAKKIKKPGEWSVDEEYTVGTIAYLAPEIKSRNASVRNQVCYTDKTEIFALGKTLQFVLHYLFQSIFQHLSSLANSRSYNLYQQLVQVANMMCFEAPANRIGLEYVHIWLLNILWQSSCVDSAMNMVQKRESFNAFTDLSKSPFKHIETLTCLMTITRLTGVMIMRRAHIQNPDELKANLSKELFHFFCRLDSLITHSQCGELVLKLFENVNHALSRWDAATSPSPIELFEREISQPDYEILKVHAHSSESSCIGSFVSGASTLISSTVSAVLSVGGLFSAEKSPSRRQRREKNDHENDDFCP